MTNQAKEERRAVLGGAGKTLVGSAFFALLGALAFGGISLFGAALFFSYKPNATPYIGTVGCALGALAALFGGFGAGRRQKHAGALAGLLFGVLYLIVLLLLSRFGSMGTPLPKRLIGYAIFLLLSALGGALGSMRVGERHHKKRKR
ncbi:MAG: TIGR04086 family membrane protein [Ruminococcaceae bacterium]|nr:TIGR04086 family membrane protein [Oscillospiraceae bacterium]